MSRRTKVPSRKSLRETLNESAFDPREPGPLKVIVESADANYYEQRAMEYIREARAAVAPFSGSQEGTQAGDTYNDCMTNAIALLGLAKLTRKG